jgi:DNA-binding SARP family transcriptional activator/TolB-like protein
MRRPVESCGNFVHRRHSALHAVSQPRHHRFTTLNTVRLKTFGGLSLDRPDAAPDAGLRPRSLALLAILAAAGAKGLTRDRIMAVLWPEVDEDRARHGLSQMLYSLRRDLGEDVVLTTAALRLDSERISADVTDFRASIAAKDWGTASALYTGPFLDGFVLAGAPEFERWAESERAALATLGIRAIEGAAKASTDAGQLDEAAELWHRLTQLDPTDPRLAAAYMQALDALGGRGAALAHGRAHAELIRREYEAEPHSAIERLMTGMRELHVTGSHAAASHATPTPTATTLAAPEPTTVFAPPAAIAPTPPPPPAPVIPESAAPSRASSRVARTVLVGAIAFGVVAAASLGWRWISAARRAPNTVLAVGRIRDLAAPDSAALAGVLREMLATSLGRVAELKVVANSRMLELTPRDADTSRSAYTDAARRSGATEVVEGELIPLPEGKLRLEVRRVELARGLVRGGYRISGSERIALLDSMTALIAADLRVGAPNGSLADVSTRSPIAYRLYEEGLRALYHYDAYAANNLLHAAIREDSTFAMATYYAWRAARAVGDPDEWRLAERALALASRAPSRDRLLVVTHVGGELADLAARAAAETLATNYPGDPEALVHAAEVTADLPRAVALFDRAIALDSAASPGALAFCRLCDAMTALTTRYRWADSNDAALRTLQRWIALRPKDAAPWMILADFDAGFGRRAEADAATSRFEALGGWLPSSQVSGIMQSLRFDDLEAADRACAAGLLSADSAQLMQYRWYCTIALRMEGRYREARALLREGRLPHSTVVRRGLPYDAYMAAIVDMEMGFGRAAADEFRAIYRPDGSSDTTRARSGYRARYATWTLTLSATAAVAGGDTLRARHLIDSIEAFGAQSLYLRDAPLHHFVRGLLLARAGRHAAAADEYRAALVSPTFGYTRINYELGASLLASGRSAEAIPLVQAALHGGLEGSNLYVTRTELHELLARLFDAAGRRDSAAAHFRVVERVSRAADPFVRPRYEAARAWLARDARR